MLNVCSDEKSFLRESCVLCCYLYENYICDHTTFWEHCYPPFSCLVDLHDITIFLGCISRIHSTYLLCVPNYLSGDFWNGKFLFFGMVISKSYIIQTLQLVRNFLNISDNIVPQWCVALALTVQHVAKICSV